MAKKQTHDEWIRGLLPAVERERPKNSFTIEEAMEATNHKRSTMTRIINEKVESGELEKRKIIINGRNGWVFIPINKK